MSIVLGVIVLAAVGLFIGGQFYGALTDPASDRADIRAKYEGLGGADGPSVTVVSIRRDGVAFRGPHSSALFRRYQVVLQNQNGDRHSKTVGVPVGLRGSGDVIDLA